LKLRDPLVGFLLLSVGVFAFYGLAGARGGDEARLIVVTRAEVEGLKAGFSRAWLRSPDDAELRALVEDHVRTEVLAREAVAMGLDRDDSVIRRHLRTKLETIADESVRVKPSEAELAAYLAAKPEVFRQDPRFTFRQVFLNPDRRGEALERDAKQLLDKLQQLGSDAETTKLGDTTLLEPAMKGASRSEVARTFGEAFATELLPLEIGRWQGPVVSSYGVHLVLLEERQEGRVPELDEVRAAVEREWSVAQVQAAKQAFYDRLRRRYVVIIEIPGPPSPRTGAR
jgi:PPIC-type PPIASE domain